MSEQLTKQQQQLAESNHKLIYKFANQKNLAIDEYYDILAIGLCKAAKIFDENKSKFSTIAYRCMENEVKMYWTSNTRKHIVPKDMVSSYDGNDYLLVNYTNTHSVHDIVASNIILRKFLNTLTEKEKIIVKLLIIGLTQSEIAIRINCTRQGVSHYIQKIRKRWIMYSNYKM